MIYALVEIVVFDYLDNIPKGMYIVISCAVVVVDIALFDPTRGMIQTFVDKRFFRVRYNFRTEQKKLTEDIKHALDSFRLSELVVGRIFTLIPTEYLAFVITENTGANVLSRYSKKGATYPHDEHCSLLGDELFRALALPSAVESGADVAEVQSPSLRRGEIVAVVPMYSESGAVLGCIAAGEKMAGTRYSLEDIDLLTTAAEQSALMLERFTLQEKLLFKFAEAKRLEELNRLKSLFVAGVTHELKTPLTSIKMFAELLRYAPDDTSKKTEYLEIIEGEADRLTRLINTVLDFSKVEHGVKEYNVTQCLFNDIAKRTISSMMYQVSMLGFHLAVHYDPQELVISADPDAIAEIIINLLSNAMKYSGQNKRIIFSTFSTPKTAGISVQDFGVGMSEETQKNIFQPYFRANDAEVQKTAGAGLGLSLVRHITDAHNATIRVESEPGKGSTFSVLFPRINNETNSDN